MGRLNYFRWGGCGFSGSGSAGRMGYGDGRRTKNDGDRGDVGRN